MGCDIHFYVERVEDGAWASADRWTPDGDSEANEPPVTLDYKDSFYHDRNYDLFAILAGVRNGRGFAGCDTGDGFVPISEPRGLPEDLSPQVRAEAERWDGDGHSHSWLTVQELLDYDWTQTTTHRGFVTAADFWRWNRWDRGRGESPKSWCGMVDGAAIRKVGETELTTMLDAFGRDWSAEDRIKRELAGVHARCEWEQPYYKAVRRFWSDAVPRLLRVGKPTAVRCVFWFDN